MLWILVSQQKLVLLTIKLKCRPKCSVDLNPLYFSALHRHCNYPAKSTRLFFPFLCARSESVKSRGEAKYILIWMTRLFIEIAWMLVCDEHSFPSAFYTNGQISGIGHLPGVLSGGWGGNVCERGSSIMVERRVGNWEQRLPICHFRHCHLSLPRLAVSTFGNLRRYAEKRIDGAGEKQKE